MKLYIRHKRLYIAYHTYHTINTVSLFCKYCPYINSVINNLLEHVAYNFLHFTTYVCTVHIMYITYTVGVYVGYSTVDVYMQFTCVIVL